MHDTQQDPVDVGQMIAWIADGETPDGQQKIGTEHEKFLFHRQTLAPVAYEGEAGIGVLLERLLTDLGPGAEPIMENGNIIGIVDADGGAVASATHCFQSPRIHSMLGNDFIETF